MRWWHHVLRINWPADHSCALGPRATAVLRLPPEGRNAADTHTHTHSSPRECWNFSTLDANRPSLSPGVGGSVSTKRTNHRPETKGEEKSKKYNTWSWIFRYKHTKSCLHINMFCFCPSWRVMCYGKRNSQSHRTASNPSPVQLPCNLQFP